VGAGIPLIHTGKQRIALVHGDHGPSARIFKSLSVTMMAISMMTSVSNQTGHFQVDPIKFCGFCMLRSSAGMTVAKNQPPMRHNSKARFTPIVSIRPADALAGLGLSKTLRSTISRHLRARLATSGMGASERKQ
jgi:hypothetical protein